MNLIKVNKPAIANFEQLTFQTLALGRSETEGDAGNVSFSKFSMTVYSPFSTILLVSNKIED